MTGIAGSPPTERLPRRLFDVASSTPKPRPARLTRIAQSDPLRLAIWTSIPTHHQSGFHRALRDAGIDLRVQYLQHVTSDRLRLGWAEPRDLPAGERYLEPGEDVLRSVLALRDRIHIVPGANSRAMLRLCVALSLNGIPWLHWSEPGRPRSRWSLRMLLRRVYATVVNEFALGALANGELARRDFVDWGIDPSRIRFLPYSIPGLEPAAGEPVATIGTRFMQVGVLCPRKGTDVLLGAFAEVLRHDPRSTLALVGYDATDGEYARSVRRLGIAQSVEFVGAVPAAQVAAAMSRADVIVLASRFDGWGVALNEAASLGRALISTTATGAAHHLIHNDTNGFMVAAGDTPALAAAMCQYVLTPALAAAHGRRSQEIFREFTPAANALRLRGAISDLLALDDELNA
jgi:glycosyltransferase involved in cell wall biosynthesis